MNLFLANKISNFLSNCYFLQNSEKSYPSAYYGNAHKFSYRVSQFGNSRVPKRLGGKKKGKILKFLLW